MCTVINTFVMKGAATTGLIINGMPEKVRETKVKCIYALILKLGFNNLQIFLFSL